MLTMSMLTNLPRKPTGANQYKGLEVTVDNVHSDQLSQGNLREPINIREREELVIIYKVPTLPKKPTGVNQHKGEGGKDNNIIISNPPKETIKAPQGRS